MSNLTNNTTNLQAILDTINTLHEAGSGGASVETCTLNIGNGYCYCTTYDNDAITSAHVDTGSFTAVKNSMLFHRATISLGPMETIDNYSATVTCGEILDTIIEEDASDSTKYYVTMIIKVTSDGAVAYS